MAEAALANSEPVTADSDVYRKFVVLPEKIRREVIAWCKASKSVKIFITGQTGVGKSSLVNALIGDKVAEEGDTLDPETSKVTSYEKTIRDVQVTVWDSPGLQDGTSREEEYLADMEENCKDVDLCVYCVSLLDTRFVEGCDDIIAMKKLTGVFGQAMWEHAIFVLTFANMLEEDAELLEAEDAERPAVFQKKLKEWERALKDALISDVGVDRAVAEGIQVIPAGYDTNPALLDRDFWLSPFWFGALYAMKPMAQPAMLKINYHRIIQNPEEVTEEDFNKFVHEQPLIFSKRGAEIGKKYGESKVGEAIGLSVGDDIAEDIQIDVQIAAELHRIASQKDNFSGVIIIVVGGKNGDEEEIKS